MASTIQVLDSSTDKLSEYIKKNQYEQRPCYPYSSKDLGFPEDSERMYEILFTYVEIQNMVMLFSHSKDTSASGSAIVYETRIGLCKTDELVIQYIKLLSMFFRTVSAFDNGDFVVYYKVSNARNAEKVFADFRQEYIVDSYVQLFDKHYLDLFQQPFEVKEITSNGEMVSENKLLDYYKQALFTNKMVAINIIGFTVEEIQTLPQLVELFSAFEKTIILFSQGISIAGYIFLDNL